MPTVQTFFPAPEKTIGAKFGEHSAVRKKLGLGPHRGLDFKVKTGTPLLAIGDGTVVFNGWSSVLGHQLEIRCNVIVNGKRVRKVFNYSHLREAPALKIGDKVKGGEPICISGNSGSASSGPHLHLMAGNNPRLAVNPVEDPLPLIESASKKGGVTLEK